MTLTVKVATFYGQAKRKVATSKVKPRHHNNNAATSVTTSSMTSSAIKVEILGFLRSAYFALFLGPNY